MGKEEKRKKGKKVSPHAFPSHPKGKEGEGKRENSLFQPTGTNLKRKRKEKKKKKGKKFSLENINCLQNPDFAQPERRGKKKKKG